MNNKTKKQLGILIVLLISLSISLFSQLFNEPDVRVLPGKQGPLTGRNFDSNEVVAVDLLSNETPEFTSVKRNIFQFNSGSGSAPSAQSYSPVESPPPQVVPTAPPLPEVHYLGFYYEKDTGLKMASLSNTGRIFVGKAGQVLGGKYEVIEIAQDYVILKLRLQQGKVIRVPFGKAPAVVISGEDQPE